MARQSGAAVLMLMGAHVIRAGVARQLIDLMQSLFVESDCDFRLCHAGLQVG